MNDSTDAHWTTSARGDHVAFSHFASPPAKIPGAPVLTVGDVLGEHLRALSEVDRRSPTTVETYRSVARKWILPVLGDKPVDQVGPEDIEGIAVSMAQAGRSQSMIMHVRSLWRDSLERACRTDLVTVTAPPLMRRSTDTARYHGPATDSSVAFEATVAAVVSAARNHPVTQLAIRLAFDLGIGRSQVVGLRWSAIDFEAQTVIVMRAATPGGVAEQALDVCAALGAETFVLLRQVRASHHDAAVWVLSSDGGLTPWSAGHLSNRWAAVRSRVPSAAGMRLDDLRARARTLPVYEGDGPPRKTPRGSGTPSPHSWGLAFDAHLCPACDGPLAFSHSDGAMGPGASELRRLLTAREDAVSMLAAKGQSNVAIAAELFVGVKSVEFHLTNVFKKLGLLNRTQLALLFRPSRIEV